MRIAVPELHKKISSLNARCLNATNYVVCVDDEGRKVGAERSRVVVGAEARARPWPSANSSCHFLAQISGVPLSKIGDTCKNVYPIWIHS
jgi:hypothetical protein